jgi:thiamine-phosphate pyrophosphorylase
MNIQYITSGKNIDELIANTAKAILNDINWIQIRVKDVSDQEFILTANRIKVVIPEKVTVLLNDRYHLVDELKADGVHIGQNDANPDLVREYLGDNKILGITANKLNHIKSTINSKPDYYGIGPYRFTKTKSNLSPILSLEDMIEMRLWLERSYPNTFVVPIGGITFDDFLTLKSAGFNNLAMSGAINKL